MCCNKIFHHQFDERLKKRFFNTYKFANNDKNKFILLLQKRVYAYQYMDNWEKFNKTSLPFAHLNMEDATDSDYASAKRVCKGFEMKHLGDYHYLYVESNALLLADVFENFRNIYLKRYELDPAKILSAPGLA